MPDAATSSSVPAARRRSFDVGGHIPLAALIVLVAIAALAAPRFLSVLNLTNVLVQGAVMAVVAMGMTFVIIGGGFDLSVGSTVALAGCIGSAVMLKAGVAAGVIAGVAVGALVGVVNGVVVAVLRVNPFITTLGTMVLVRGVVYLVTGGAPVEGEFGLPSAFIAFGTARLFGISLLVWVPAVLLL